MPKNDFDSTNFANFEEVVHNFGSSDNDMIQLKNAYFQYMQTGLMPNLIKKSWMVSIADVILVTWYIKRQTIQSEV